VTLYPVHRVLQALGDGRGAACLAAEEDEAYFRPTAPVAPEELTYRSIAYRQTYSHPDPARPETFQLDANPTKPDVDGWLGHRINDGATLAPGCSSEAEILRYYQESGARRNLCAVALCVPLLGFVTTRDVPKGAELFATYGHGYWLQADMPCSEAVEEVLQTPAKEAVMWQVATDKKYRSQIIALDRFIMDTSSADIDQHVEKLKSQVDAASPDTSAEKATPAPRGFGKANSRPKANGKGRKAR